MLEKFSGSWRPNSPANTANKMAREFGLGFIRTRMGHGRHRNVKEILLADQDKKVMSGIDYINPHESKYNPKCTCRGTKVDGKCIMKEQCKNQAVVYINEWAPTGHIYVGKTQDFLAKRQRDHVQSLKGFFDTRKEYLKHQAANQTPKPTAPKQNKKSQTKTNSNPKSKSKLQISTNNNQSQASQPNLITPTNKPSCRCRDKSKCIKICKKLVPSNQKFTFEFGRTGEEAYENLHNPNLTPSSRRSKGPKPTNPKELQIAYNKIHCSELTKLLWEEVEMHEKHVRKKFSKIDDMNKWVRSNLKVSVLYKQSLSSRMKTSGTKNCSLCKQERMHIYLNMNNPKKSKLLLNKRAELMTRCSCTTSFLRLVNLKWKEGADEVKNDRKWSTFLCEFSIGMGPIGTQ